MASKLTLVVVVHRIGVGTIIWNTPTILSPVFSNKADHHQYDDYDQKQHNYYCYCCDNIHGS